MTNILWQQFAVSVLPVAELNQPTGIHVPSRGHFLLVFALPIAVTETRAGSSVYSKGPLPQFILYIIIY